MFRQSQRSAFLIGLILLVVPLCPPDVARADDAAEFNRLDNEAVQQYGNGKYSEMERTAQKMKELAEGGLKQQPLRLADALRYLGIAARGKRRYAEAEPLYKQSLAIREKALGSDHPDVAQSLDDLAGLYKDMSQYAKAEPLYQHSLKIRESTLGPDHPKVAMSLHSLATLHYDMGQYAKAEPLYQHSLKIRESKLGPNHPDVALTLNNLANLYWKTGQYAKAEPLYQRSLKIKESKLGPDHPLVASSLNNLANLYGDMGQYAKAVPILQRSLKIKESQLGPDHPAVALSLNNLAALYWNMGQYAKAEPLYQRSVTIMESTLGPDHPAVATSLNNLAALYQSLDQYAKAEPLYQRSLNIRESKLGPDHPAVATSLNNLAIVYCNMGEYAKAEPLYQRSLKIMESQLGSDHPDVAAILNNLAELCRNMGQYAKAEPLCRRSLKIMESTLGLDHPAVATSLYNLAVLHAETERWSEAIAETERERRIVRRHVAHTLPALSEKEQLTFLQIQDEKHLHVALSLGLQRRADAQSALRSAGWVLNGKAVAQEVLAQRAILTAAGTDPTLADLIKQLLSVRSRLATLSLATPKLGREADHRQQFQTLNQQEQELSRQLGQASGRKTTGDPWVEPTAVRKAMAKDAVLIEMARFGVWNFKEEKRLPPHYTAWLIPAEGQGQIAILDLGEAQKIEDTVRNARKVLDKAEATIRKEGEAKAEKQLHDAMGDLAKLVLEPLEAHLGQARQLIISPDAALWLVPWGALPLADGKYAIEKYQIRYCISGRDLVSQTTGSDQKTTCPILFANPDYDLGAGEADAATRAVLRDAAPAEQVASSRGLGSLSSLPRVARLPGTAVEAAAIKPNVTRYAKSEAVVYEDQYALEGVFKALRRPKVLVLSTHGFFMPDQEVEHKDKLSAGLAEEDSKGAVLTKEGKPLENPLLRCGLLLTGCNRQADGAAGLEDGILTGLEIVGTNLRGTELVVLSACETGLGQVRNGEGVAGLRQAFQLAGAEVVVSTLWQIPDEETVDLMNAFFANLSKGQTKADALRNAQLALIKFRRANHSAAHPHYWAAFTLTGE